MVDGILEEGEVCMRNEWSPAEGDLYVCWGLRRICEAMNTWFRKGKINCLEKEYMTWRYVATFGVVVG